MGSLLQLNLPRIKETCVKRIYLLVSLIVCYFFFLSGSSLRRGKLNHLSGWALRHTVQAVTIMVYHLRNIKILFSKIFLGSHPF